MPPDTRSVGSGRNERRASVTPMRNSVAASIAMDIAAGALNPGDALPNDKALAARFGASRTVVREAIQLLSIRRVLDVRHGSGTYALPVRQWDLHDPLLVEVLEKAGALHLVIRDLLDVRRIVESEAAALAAERSTDEERQELTRIFDDLVSHQYQYAAYLDAHWRFHRHILVCSHNPLLVSFDNQIDALQRSLLTRHFRRNPRFQEGAGRKPGDGETNVHESILIPIMERRPDRARAAMLTHVQSLERLAHTLVSESGEDG